MTFDKFLVESSISICRAVCCDQQLRAVKIWCIYRHQLDLHRPLGETAGLLHRYALAAFTFTMFDLPGLGSRTATGKCFSLCLHLFLLIFQNCGFVISCCFPLHKGNGSCGACRQTVAQAITVVIPHQLGLAIHHGDGSFMTGIGAGTAAVAFLLIDLYDPSFHCAPPLIYRDFIALIKHNDSTLSEDLVAYIVLIKLKSHDTKSFPSLTVL